jgi:hypothetical protein
MNIFLGLFSEVFLLSPSGPAKKTFANMSPILSPFSSVLNVMIWRNDYDNDGLILLVKLLGKT